MEGEPTLIYSMGGTHIEAVRRETAGALADVRSSRNGHFADVMVERIRELGHEKGRIGLLEIEPRHGDYLPVNQYMTLRDTLPDAVIVLLRYLMHALPSVHSEEDHVFFRRARDLCPRALSSTTARPMLSFPSY